MIKRISLLGKSGVLSIGLSAACLALACGSEPTTDDPAQTTDPPPDMKDPDQIETAEEPAVKPAASDKPKTED